jgi:ribonuclease HIII
MRSPSICIYRRAAARFDALREALVRHDFHAVVPPDALAEWEYLDDRSVRVRLWMGTVLVEAIDAIAMEEFDARHRLAFPSDGVLPDGGEAPERVSVVAGSDESGKGERGRTLAVAAVAVPVDAEGEALARGVRDSKLCTAGEIAELDRWIRRQFAHAVRRLDAEERADELRAAAGNETRLLAALHARCLREIGCGAAFPLARVDRFGAGRPVAKLVPEVIVDECVRGERHVACAAASIVARAAALGIHA